MKSVFDNSRGPRIDYNVAIKVQRNLIADYINNFRQGKCSLRDPIPFVQSKKQEKHHEGVSLIVKLQDSACNFTNSNAA